MTKAIYGILSVYILASSAHGQNNNISSISPRTTSLGGASQVGLLDAFSVIDQPAGISHSEKTLIGVTMHQNNYSLDQVIPSGQSAAWESSSGLAQNPQNDSDLQSSRWLGLGMNLPLARNFNFGLAAFMPADRLASIYAHSSNDPQYLFYGNRAAKPSIYTAFSIRLPFGLSAGAGLYYSLKAEGKAQIAATGDRIENRIQLDLKPEYLPYGGLQWASQNEAGPRYSADFSYRAPQSAGSRLDVDLLIQTEDISLPLNVGGELIPYYDPETYKLAFATETQNFNLYASAIHSRWSAYKPPVVDVYGNDDPGSGMDDVQSGDLGLKNATSYHLGVETPLNQILSLNGTSQHIARLGSSYQESATSKSVKRLLLLDTEKYSVSMGYGLNLAAGTITTQAIEFALGIQKTWLMHRNFAEASNSSRIAQAGGSAWSAQGGVAYVF